MSRILHSSAVRVKRSPPSAAAAAMSASAAGWPSRGTSRRTGGRTIRRTGGRTCAPLRRPGSPAMMRTRRIAVDIRARMVIMPARRGRRRRRRRCDHRTPCVADDRVLHNDRLVHGRLDARAVAMGTDGCSVGMGHDLHAIADRAERTVNVAAVYPRSGRHAAGRENQRRSRDNRQIVLVHSAPHFPFYTKQGEQKPEI